jgi:hypothetical protein
MDTGLLVGARVLCPWHNAAFSVVTGAGIDMPARDALDSYPVEVRRRAPALCAACGRHQSGMLPAAAPPPPPPPLRLLRAACALRVRTALQLRAAG